MRRESLLPAVEGGLARVASPERWAPASFLWSWGDLNSLNHGLSTATARVLWTNTEVFRVWRGGRGAL